MVQPLWNSVWKILRKVKINLPYELVITLLGICPKNSTHYSIDTWLAMFTAKFFTMPRQINQPTSPSTGRYWKSGTYKQCNVVKQRKWILLVNG